MNKEVSGLTNEQIARVFAMYQGQKVLCFPADDAYSQRWLPPTTLEWNVIAGTHYGVRNTILALTTLSAISNEDAIEVAKLCGLVIREKDEDIIGWLKCNAIEEAKNRLLIEFDYFNFSAHQYLIQKGYAVPLFIEAGHPDNGKTAIELRIAIDKTKTTQP